MHPFEEIKTERLFLRKLRESDWEMIFYLRSDPEVNRFVIRPAAETREKALEFIHRIGEEYKTAKSWYWCISLKEDPKMIGSISLWNFSKDRKTAEVGYDLSPGFHGRGIMNEALAAILDFGFQQLSLDRVEAYTQWNNESSVKLLKNREFVLVEGITDEDNEDNRVFRIYNSS